MPVHYHTSKNNETGRTMVEMFSVIIIISVLTFIGVGSFSYARDRYYGNRTAQAVLQEGTVLLTNRKLKSLSDAAEPPLQTDMDRLLPAGAGSSRQKIGNNEYRITITNLNSRVCEFAVAVTGPYMTANGDNCADGTAVFSFKRGN